MKTVKAICVSIVLALALSVPAYAGDVLTPGVTCPDSGTPVVTAPAPGETEVTSTGTSDTTTATSGMVQLLLAIVSII
jgi:hypothetical protein